MPTAAAALPATASPGTAAEPSRQVLALRLGAAEYGIDLLRVHEVRSYEQPTRVAHTPAHVTGVINLRGAIVPIVDLRLMLRVHTAGPDASAVIVVLRAGHRIVGLVADALHDVVALTAAHLQPATEREAGPAREALHCIGRIEQRTLLLLDIDRLLADAELGPIEPTLQ